MGGCRQCKALGFRGLIEGGTPSDWFSGYMEHDTLRTGRSSDNGCRLLPVPQVLLMWPVLSLPAFLYNCPHSLHAGCMSNVDFELSPRQATLGPRVVRPSPITTFNIRRGLTLRGADFQKPWSRNAQSMINCSSVFSRARASKTKASALVVSNVVRREK